VGSRGSASSQRLLIRGSSRQIEVRRLQELKARRAPGRGPKHSPTL
jgi:hypothetical protein